MKIYVRSFALSERKICIIGIPRKEKYEAFEMCCYRNMMKIKWEDKIRYEELLQHVTGEKKSWKYLVCKREKLIVHNLLHSCLLAVLMKLMIDEKI